MYVYPCLPLPSPRVLTSLRYCSIAESVAASSVVLALCTQRPCWTRRHFRLFTHRVVRPSRLMRPLPRPFSPHACATRVMPKSTAPLPLTPLPCPHPRPLCRHRGPHPIALVDPHRAVHGPSLWHRHHRILHSPMTCETTRFGSVPIFAKPPEVEGGPPNHRPFPIT